jgi:hypothetical protein
MEKSSNKNNNRVQIILNEEDTLLYQKVRYKKGFFSAMLNMAYKNQTYRDMFFDMQDGILPENKSESSDAPKVAPTTQKKKTSVSSW